MTAKLCKMAIWNMSWPPDLRRALSPPQSFEPVPGGSGVADGVLGMAVAEIVLDQAKIIASVGEREAAGVAQHVRVDRRQRRAIPRLPRRRRHALPEDLRPDRHDGELKAQA